MNKSEEREVKKAIRRHYAELAMADSCCGPDCCQPSTSQDEHLPKESIASAASCGSPVAHALLTEGQTVLDLGSGAGIDVFRASKAVGSTGRVIGVDSTPEMLIKAREVAEKYGYSNVEFRLSEIEHLPVKSNSVDVVISNCVLNLVPDKGVAFKEIYRVLKPAGRFVVSDMNATGETKKELPENPEDWAACITGAIPVNEYERLLSEAGFRNIEHKDENSSIDETSCSQGLAVKSVAWFATKPST